VTSRRKASQSTEPRKLVKQYKVTQLSKATEEALWSKGFVRVAGVDEAGRGPLAGPVRCPKLRADAVTATEGQMSFTAAVMQVVACACAIVHHNISIDGVIDSKQIKEDSRVHMFRVLTGHPGIKYGMCVLVSP
jgi:hypothetical protein